MAETLFPQRQRCRTCSKKLGDRGAEVLLGLFCSPKCGKLPTLPDRPEDGPRECRTQRDGQWAWKRQYRSEVEIPDKLRQDPSTSWYWCPYGHLHIGHTRMGQAEQFRMFDHSQDLRTEISDLLVKLRGQATHKQVAAAAGIRPIRLKELEEGTAHPENLDALAAVLKAYRTKLGVALPSGR